MVYITSSRRSKQKCRGTRASTDGTPYIVGSPRGSPPTLPGWKIPERLARSSTSKFEMRFLFTTEIKDIITKICIKINLLVCEKQDLFFVINNKSQ